MYKNPTTTQQQPNAHDKPHVCRCSPSSQVSRSGAKKLLKEADADGNGRLSFDEFVTLLRKLRSRPEVTELFGKYASGAEMTVSEFQNFLSTEQKDTFDEEKVK